MHDPLVLTMSTDDTPWSIETFQNQNEEAGYGAITSPTWTPGAEAARNTPESTSPPIRDGFRLEVADSDGVTPIVSRKRHASTPSSLMIPPSKQASIRGGSPDDPGISTQSISPPTTRRRLMRRDALFPSATKDDTSDLADDRSISARIDDLDYLVDDLRPILEDGRRALATQTDLGSRKRQLLRDAHEIEDEINVDKLRIENLREKRTQIYNEINDVEFHLDGLEFASTNRLRTEERRRREIEQAATAITERIETAQGMLKDILHRIG